jgi:hypothetical protein
MERLPTVNLCAVLGLVRTCRSARWVGRPARFQRGLPLERRPSLTYRLTWATLVSHEIARGRLPLRACRQGRSRDLVKPDYQRALPCWQQNKISPHRERGLEAGWDAEKILMALAAML